MVQRIQSKVEGGSQTTDNSLFMSRNTDHKEEDKNDGLDGEDHVVIENLRGKLWRIICNVDDLK